MSTSSVRDETIGDVLREAASDSADRVALVMRQSAADPGIRWTFGELLSDAETVAKALLGRFAPGDRVAVWAPNSPEWLLLRYGAALAGLTLVTVNPNFRPHEMAHVVGQSRSCGLFHAVEHRGRNLADDLRSVEEDLVDLREVVSFADWDAFLGSRSDATELPEVLPSDPAQILYTSGTTGFPKGAVLHHRGICNNARFGADGLGVQSGSVWLNPGLPLFHAGGCVMYALGSLQARCTHVVMPEFNAGDALAVAEAEGATVMGAVPTMLIAMLEHPDFEASRLEQLELVQTGGANVPPDLVRRIATDMGCQPAVVYGQTETSGIVTITEPGASLEEVATTVGRAMPHANLKIVDPVTRQPVGTGVTGELCVQGYLVMDGYFELPEATAETIDADGWLSTGDLCQIDDRGVVAVTGRLREMIIRGGENIYPREIEELLRTHPAVEEVAVVGLPDDRWGEQVAAFIHLSSGAQTTKEELDGFVRATLAPHKAPRRWFFLDELPVNALGKVQKFALRQAVESGLIAQS